MLTVCLLSFSTHSPTSLKTTSSTSSHLPASSVRSFLCPFIYAHARTHTDTSRRTVCEARRAVSWATDWHHAHAQAFLQSPVTCMLRHTPRLQAEAYVRHPIANCLLPALSYILSTLLQASSPRRLWNRPQHQMQCNAIQYILYGLKHSHICCWVKIRQGATRKVFAIYFQKHWDLHLLRNAIMQAIFNTHLHFWSKAHIDQPISAKLHRD